MSLNIIIVGAGIAGLTAAVSLHRSGHRVQVCGHPALYFQLLIWYQLNRYHIGI